MRSPHEILGVPRGASPEEIRRAYRALARRHHPDASGSPESAARFAEIARAYEALTEGSAGGGPAPSTVPPDPDEVDPAGVYDAFFGAPPATTRRAQTRFRRRPGTHDLEVIYPLSPAEAARGLTATLPLPDGGDARLRIPPAARDGDEIRLRGRGVRLGGGGSGDLVVVIRVVRGSGGPAMDDAS